MIQIIIPLQQIAENIPPPITLQINLPARLL